MRKRGNGLLIASMIPFFLFVFLFLIVPLVFMIYGSFQGNGGIGFTFDQYKEVFQNAYYHQAFKNSILISFFSSLIAIVLAVFATYSITQFSKKIQDRILVFANLTSNFAGIPLAFAFIVLLGNSGLFTLLFKHFGWETLSSFQFIFLVGLGAHLCLFSVAISRHAALPSVSRDSNTMERGCLPSWGLFLSVLASNWDPRHHAKYRRYLKYSICQCNGSLRFCLCADGKHLQPCHDPNRGPHIRRYFCQA